jgi:hypothetical protein
MFYVRDVPVFWHTLHYFKIHEAGEESELVYRSCSEKNDGGMEHNCYPVVMDHTIKKKGWRKRNAAKLCSVYVFVRLKSVVVGYFTGFPSDVETKNMVD